MARLPRLFIPGRPQHIAQRGHNRMAVLIDDDDRRRYLHCLAEALRGRDVALHAYALMPDQAHLLVTAADAAASSSMMQALGRAYARHFNRRRDHAGTIWEGRFRSAAVATDAFVLACYRYIDQGAVRAGLVEQAGQWPWSSWSHHIGQRGDALVSDHPAYWALGNTPFERQAAYERLAGEPLAPDLVARITAAVLGGWALGSPEKAGALPTRRADRLRPGRPARRNAPARVSDGDPGDDAPSGS